MAKVKTVKFGPFKGLNNVSDPISTGPGELIKADNVVVNANGSLSVREGYTPAMNGAFKSGISTDDNQRIFAQNGQFIVKINEVSGVATEQGLCALSTDDECLFMEVNKEIYFSNGIDSGIIKQDNTVHDWGWFEPNMPMAQTNANSGLMDEGMYQIVVTHILEDDRETGPSQEYADFSNVGDQLVIGGLTPDYPVKKVLVYIKPPKSSVFQLIGEATGDIMTWDGNVNDLGEELLSEFVVPPPGSFEDFVFWRGQVCWMQYDELRDETYIFFSEPLIYHLFRTDNYLKIKGKGTNLGPHELGLLITTTTEILGFDGEKISSLASYGSPSGYAVVAEDNGTMLIWTDRGWRSFFPFTEMMSNQVSVSPGEYVGAALMERNGAKRVIAVVKPSGTPFNRRDN